LRAAESCRCHTDDRERLSVQANVETDNVLAFGEAPFPERGADHGHRVGTGRDIVARLQQSSPERPHA